MFDLHPPPPPKKNPTSTIVMYTNTLMYMHASDKKNHLATVSLKVVSRKRRRKCTLKSYDFYVWSFISIETTIHFKYVFNTD